MEPNRSVSLFGSSSLVESIKQREVGKSIPLESNANQHLVSQRIAGIYLEHFNDSIATYLQAKKEGRYSKVADIFGDKCVVDEAKEAMFESLIWAFELCSFDRIPFASCCMQADDDHHGDPENIRVFLSKHLKGELLEMVEFIRSSTPADKAKRIVDKLSEYITCPVAKAASANEEVFA